MCYNSRQKICVNFSATMIVFVTPVYMGVIFYGVKSIIYDHTLKNCAKNFSAPQDRGNRKELFMDNTKMGTEPINRLLVRMSLPMVVSMLVNSMYNIVDSFFVAKISENAMTALSLVFPIQNLINAAMIGFGIGVNASIAFYLGAKNMKQAQKSANQGMLLAAFHGILLTALCILGMRPFLQLFTKNAEIIELGVNYSNIAFSFSIVIAWQLVLEKTFQAVGRMTTTMICMLAGFVTNIILDPVLIFGLSVFPEMGIKGAALATGLGQTVSLLFYLLYYRFAPIPIKLCQKDMKLERSVCRRLYAVGIPGGLNMALPSLLISVLNVILVSFSQSYVFVLGVYYKLQTFLYLPANGVIQGMRPIVGYNYGAGEHKRVHKTFYTACMMICGIMALGTVLCIVFPGQLFGIFTENADTLDKGATALRILCIGFIVSSVSVTATGVLEGLGKGFSSLLISLCRYALLIIPIAFALSHIIGAAGVWHAFWITELITSLFAYVHLIRIFKKIQSYS